MGAMSLRKEVIYMARTVFNEYICPCGAWYIGNTPYMFRRCIYCGRKVNLKFRRKK
jgi:hypothetical protein